MVLHIIPIRGISRGIQHGVESFRLYPVAKKPQQALRVSTQHGTCLYSHTFLARMSHCLQDKDDGKWPCQHPRTGVVLVFLQYGL